jgi:hypothetical protein
MAVVNLTRISVNIPDDGFFLRIVFEDRGNPFIDEAGNPTNNYQEFVEIVPIPADISLTLEAIQGLVSQGETAALEKAQIRADNLTVKTAILPLLEILNAEGA